MMFEEQIKQCLKVLRQGGTILYPTDTIWGIGCDATNEKAVEKIFSIKKRKESKSLIVLVCSHKKLTHYVEEVPDIAYDLMDSIERPLTIIYPQGRNLAKNVLAEDGSIGIRVVKNPFVQELIKEFGEAIVSSSANISGEPAPLIYNNISGEIKSSVDYDVYPYSDTSTEVKASTIIRLGTNNEFTILRD